MLHETIDKVTEFRSQKRTQLAKDKKHLIFRWTPTPDHFFRHSELENSNLNEIANHFNPMGTLKSNLIQKNMSAATSITTIGSPRHSSSNVINQELDSFRKFVSMRKELLKKRNNSVSKKEIETGKDQEKKTIREEYSSPILIIP